MLISRIKMPFSPISKKLGADPKNEIVGTFLVANAFLWYLGAFKFLQIGFINNSLLIIISVNILCLALAALSVTLSINRFRNRLTFIKYWVLGGLPLSAAFAFLPASNFLGVAITSGILGIYFGLGMPICMGYFSSTTRSENRAKYSAIIILMIGLGFPIFTLIDSTQTLMIASALTGWRVLALVSIFLLTPSEKIAEPKNAISYRSVITNKTFLLYLVPWFMFVLINDLTSNINSINFSHTLGGNYLIVENVLSGISAVVCGLIADKKGRKRIALVGFALLGIGYAALGLFNAAYFAAWFYICADGIAWGAFSMLFIIALWGDIAQEKNSEKYYFLGVLPYLLSNFTGLSLGPSVTYLLGRNEATIFSFASFFLFLAILPLAYAPETLSERIIKNIDLNSYVNKALEKVKKESSKKPKSQVKITSEETEVVTEERENLSADEIAARKLAEKYY